MLYPDRDLLNADWTKQTWDLPVHTLVGLREYLKGRGMTPAQFKKLPVYQLNVQKLPWLRKL